MRAGSRSEGVKDVITLECENNRNRDVSNVYEITRTEGVKTYVFKWTNSGRLDSGVGDKL